jgi:hypothetical protein
MNIRIKNLVYIDLKCKMFIRIKMPNIEIVDKIFNYTMRISENNKLNQINQHFTHLIQDQN